MQSEDETQEEPVFQFESKDRKKPMSQFQGHQAGRILSYLGEAQLFVLFIPSTDWVRPTHVREGNLLYSVYRFKC